SATDAGHPIAGIASNRLLTAGRPAGLLYGPRSPKYGSD
ncbi:lipoprotein, partial [Pseudomonas syringae pv. actinidiae ICMP 18804]